MALKGTPCFCVGRPGGALGVRTSTGRTGDKGPGDKGPGDKGPGDKGPGVKVLRREMLQIHSDSMGVVRSSCHEIS